MVKLKWENLRNQQHPLMVIFTLDITDVFLKIKAFTMQKYTHIEHC